MDTLAKVFGATMVFFFVLSMYVSHLYFDAEYRYEMCSARNNDLLLRVDQLETSISNIKSDYLSLSSEYNSLEYEYYDLQDRYNRLRAVVSQYGEEINYVYDWLSKNGRLSDKQFSEEVSGCVSYKVINYPCVLFRRGYHYIPDPVDKAKPVSQFISDRGGDCEDYAFYAAALFRTASSNGYLLRVAKPGLGRFFLTSRWYYPGEVPLEINVVDVNVMCGDTSLDSNVAHCIVSVLGADGKTYYIEPQTGEITLPLLDPQYYAPGVVFVMGDDLRSFYRAVEEVEK